MIMTALPVSPGDDQPKPSIMGRNIRYLYIEIAFASILGSIINFNSAFAIRLGASAGLIALLSSAPFLLAALASIPAARFLAKRQHRKLWLFGSLFISRAG